MTDMSDLSGMTVNERFFVRGLDSQWEAAKQRRDRDAMIQLLAQVELADQAEWIVETLFKREEKSDEAKLAALREAIAEGDASGIAEGDVFARIRASLDLPPRSRQ